MYVLSERKGNLLVLLILGGHFYDAMLPVYSNALNDILMANGSTQENITSYQKCVMSLRRLGVGKKQTKKLEKMKRETFRKMTAEVSVFLILFFSEFRLLLF